MRYCAFFALLFTSLLQAELKVPKKPNWKVVAEVDGKIQDWRPGLSEETKKFNDLLRCYISPSEQFVLKQEVRYTRTLTCRYRMTSGVVFQKQMLTCSTHKNESIRANNLSLNFVDPSVSDEEIFKSKNKIKSLKSSVLVMTFCEPVY